MNYQYVLQRLISALVVVLGLTFVVFMIMQIVPGDPARVILGPYASDESVLGLRERLGLNRPFLEQYLSWLGGVAQGDFGQSLLNSQEVAPQLWGRVGPTFELALVSLLVGLAIAFPAGVIAALKPGSALDIVVTLFSQIGVCVPNFLDGHTAGYRRFIELKIAAAQRLHPSSRRPGRLAGTHPAARLYRWLRQRLYPDALHPQRYARCA